MVHCEPPVMAGEEAMREKAAPRLELQLASTLPGAGPIEGNKEVRRFNIVGGLTTCERTL